MADQPTVKVTRERNSRDVILYVEGNAGQRARLRICAGDDLMRVFFEHDETVALEPPTKVATVRWWERPEDRHPHPPTTTTTTTTKTATTTRGSS